MAETLFRLEKEIPNTAQPNTHDGYMEVVGEAIERSLAVCREFDALWSEDPQLVKLARQVYLEKTSFLSCSWIIQRARSKPSGFAGDYLMLVKIYDQQTPACGLGGYIDTWLLQIQLGQAVRTRLTSAREFLLQELLQRRGQIRILDVASGPCREYIQWPRFSDILQVESLALDNDPNAIAYVKEHVVPLLPQQTVLKPTQYNALRTVSAESNLREFGTCDIIYSVGLLDYLSDKHLVRMLNAWLDTLKPEGVMYVAFKDCQRYDHTIYQWLLDWYFYQRTEGDVFRLFDLAGYDVSQLESSRDASGIIINFVSSPSGRIHRVDAPIQITARPRVHNMSMTVKP